MAVVNGGPAPSGGTPKVTVFTTSGTFTPSSGMKFCIVEVQAGGGSSGGMPATAGGQCAVATHGGTGSYAKIYATAAQVGASKSVTVGAGGNYIFPSTASIGNAGGTSSFGALVSCPGGSSGRGSNPAAASTYTSGVPCGQITLGSGITLLSKVDNIDTGQAYASVTDDLYFVPPSIATPIAQALPSSIGRVASFSLGTPSVSNRATAPGTAGYGAASRPGASAFSNDTEGQGGIVIVTEYF